MKRLFTLFALSVLSCSLLAQTMTINFYNGKVVKYEFADIKSIEFDDDSDSKTTMSVYLEEAGTLSSKITKAQANKLEKLKITGHMDARDFDYIKWDCMKIEELDLSDVTIDRYSGLEGTEEGNNKTYEANEIPSGAFFYWSNTHKYVYEGMPVDEGMPSLKKIVLPQGIKAIRRNAFARAYNLTEINIPEGVESIDYVSFAICTSLEELTLPSTLKEVGKQAFADMTNMKRLYINAKTPPTAKSNSFQGITNHTILYVPSGTESIYKQAIGWGDFYKIVGIGDSESDNGSNNEDVNDVETSEESSQGQMSLKVDGESFYAVNCTAEQTSNSGMYLHIRTAEDPEFPYFGRELIVHISPSKVAELKEGDVFGANKLNVKSFKSADLIIINGTKWNELEGNITIKKITDMEMTIVINDLQIENDSSKVKHKISGTAVLTSGVYDSRGNLLSFKDAIE